MSPRQNAENRLDRIELLPSTVKIVRLLHIAPITLATSVRWFLVTRGWMDVDGHAPADFLPLLEQPHEEGALPKATRAMCTLLGKSSR